jgi:diguanylate cyclase (GGDEF)-like protein
MLRDPLTGLLNREAFVAALETTVAAERKSGLPTGLLYADLPRFAYVNKCLGMAVGDRVLTAVGHRIASHLRSTDFAGRLGADIFAIGFPNTPYEAVLLVAERLLEDITSPLDPDGEIRVAALAVARVTQTPGTTDVAAFLREAEEAMWQQKAMQPYGPWWALGLEAREATAALRSGSLVRLREGFRRCFTFLARTGRQNRRDLMTSMVPFFSCARHLGGDPEKVLAPMVADAAPLLQKAFASLCRRDSSLKAFNWSLVDTPNGPAYRWGSWRGGE